MRFRDNIFHISSIFSVILNRIVDDGIRIGLGMDHAPPSSILHFSSFILCNQLPVPRISFQ